MVPVVHSYTVTVDNLVNGYICHMVPVVHCYTVMVYNAVNGYILYLYFTVTVVTVVNEYTCIHMHGTCSSLLQKLLKKYYSRLGDLVPLDHCYNRYCSSTVVHEEIFYL